MDSLVTCKIILLAEENKNIEDATENETKKKIPRGLDSLMASKPRPLVDFGVLLYVTSTW